MSSPAFGLLVAFIGSGSLVFGLRTQDFVLSQEKPAASLHWQRVSKIVLALFRPLFSAQGTRSPARHQRGGDANKNGGCGLGP